MIFGRTRVHEYIDDNGFVELLFLRYFLYKMSNRFVTSSEVVVIKENTLLIENID